jgi:hypothetical protein
VLLRPLQKTTPQALSSSGLVSQWPVPAVHCSQTPSQAVSQHMPPTQWALRQSASSTHGEAKTA